MALRGKQPEAVQKRLKALFYGPAGVGKTTAAIQFPRPYLLDTERGAENDQYVKALKKSGGAYFATNDPDELIKEVTALLSEKHPYQTVIIDPLTVIYNDLLDRAAAEVGTDFGKHKGPADRTIKHLLNLLLRLDMNVIITSHAKPKWERTKDAKGKDTVVEAGTTFDCYGRLDYLFDLVFEIQKRGRDRVGVVRKTRIEGFPEGDVFPFSYEEVATRYGREILERSATPQVLASAEQVAELKGLLAATQVPTETIEKWMDKYKAESLEEMPAEPVVKYIEHLRPKAKIGVPA
jgi:DNA polymerase III delta prime subunit